MAVRIQQHSFAAGEVSQELFDRWDNDQIRTGLYRARNVITSPQGGVDRRPGTRGMHRIATSTEGGSSGRMFGIEVSSSLRYLAQFNSTSLKVYDVGGVSSTLEATFTNATGGARYPYEGQDLSDLDAFQQFDTLTVVHPHTAIGTYDLTRKGVGSWTLSSHTYFLERREGVSTVAGFGTDWLRRPALIKYLPSDAEITLAGGGSIGGTGTLSCDTHLFLPGHIGTVIDKAWSTGEDESSTRGMVEIIGPLNTVTLTSTGIAASQNDRTITGSSNALFSQELAAGDWIIASSLASTGQWDNTTVVGAAASRLNQVLSASDSDTITLVHGYRSATPSSTATIERVLTGALTTFAYGITFTTGSTVVSGVASSFLADVSPGDRIYRSTSGAHRGKIVYKVVDDTTIHLLSAYETTGDASTGTLALEYGDGSTSAGVRQMTAFTAASGQYWKEQLESPARGGPGAVGGHQSRLALGNFPLIPDAIAFSKSGQSDNFDVGEGLADEAIILVSSIPKTTAIKHIVSHSDLVVLTDSGVTFDANSPMTPANATLRNTEELPVADARPVKLEGGVIFATKGLGETRARVHELLFDDRTQTYQPQDLTLLASHLINTPAAMAVRRGSDQTAADHILVVNSGTNTNAGISSAGSVAVLNTLRSQQITGWTLWEMGLGGSTSAQVKDVVTIGGEVFFKTERDGNAWLERLSDTHTMDHAAKATISSNLTGTITFTNGSTVFTGSADALINTQLTSGNLVFLSSDGVDYQVAVDAVASSTSGTLITPYQGSSTSGTGVIASTVVAFGAGVNVPWAAGDLVGIRADGEFLGSTFALSSTITSTGNLAVYLPRGASTVEVGAPFSWSIVTLPVELETQGGVTSNELRRIQQVDVSVKRTEEVRVRRYPSGSARRAIFAQSTAGPGVVAETTRKRIRLFGYARDSQVEVFGQNAHPAHVESLIMEIT